MSILRQYRIKKSHKSKMALHDSKGNTYKLLKSGNLESIDVTYKDHQLLDEILISSNGKLIKTGNKIIGKSTNRVIPITDIKEIAIKPMSDKPQYEYSKSQKLSFIEFRDNGFEMSHSGHGIFDRSVIKPLHREHKKKRYEIGISSVTKMDEQDYQDFLNDRAAIDNNKLVMDARELKPFQKAIDSIKILHEEKGLSHYGLNLRPKTAIEKWRTYNQIKIDARKQTYFTKGFTKVQNLAEINNNRLDLKPELLYYYRLIYLGY